MLKLQAKASASQKGFTLIEMSIVLVIIGLIIGGILKGQEIIESSRQKNLITQINSVRSATQTFIERYQALPGDFSQAVGTATAGRISTDTANFADGNGDGIIGPPSTGTTASSIEGVDAGASKNENEQFWVHLFGARLIDGITPNFAATTFGAGSAAPAVAIPGAGMSLAYGEYADLTTDARTTHWLRVSKGSPTTLTPALTGKQMYQIDSKIDDGLPVRGSIRTGIVGSTCGTAGGGADYSAADETVACVLFADLGG